MSTSAVTIGILIRGIDEPNQTAARRLLDANADLVRIIPGSTGNHQCWPGGWLDHTLEVMRLGADLFYTFERTGRLAGITRDEQFTLSDVLLVMFLHDIEKPWRFVVADGAFVLDDRGRPAVHSEYRSKAARHALAAAKIVEYGFVLTDAHRHALHFVEGIRDEDYTPDSRIMLPLDAICHACDLLSARAFYNQPSRRIAAMPE